MDITGFVVGRRERALLNGDHGLYWKQLTRRMAIVRKKLHQQSGRGKKYVRQTQITAEDVGRDPG